MVETKPINSLGECPVCKRHDLHVTTGIAPGDQSPRKLVQCHVCGHAMPDHPILTQGGEKPRQVSIPTAMDYAHGWLDRIQALERELARLSARVELLEGENNGKRGRKS